MRTVRAIPFQLLIITLFFWADFMYAQSYKNDLKNSSISFYSKAPLEDIEGLSKDFIIIINTSNDSVLVRVPNNSFKFDSGLMEEHFNENYIESHKYKFSFFIGKLSKKLDLAKQGSETYEATGILDVHGVKRNRTLQATIHVKPDGVLLEASCDLTLADHNIAIPKIVFEKVAETVQIKLKANLVRFK